MKKTTKLQILYSLIGVAVLFLLWTVFYLVVRNEYLMPNPLAVIQTALSLTVSGEFYSALLSTLLRVIIAVLLSLSIATALAVLCVFFRGLRSVLAPITASLRALPTLAVLLLILTFTKRSFAPVVVAIISLIPLAFSKIDGDLSRLNGSISPIFKVFEVPTKKQVGVYLKGAFPSVVKEFFNLTSFGLKLIVSGEILASVYKSIGGNISQASIYSDVILLTALTLWVLVIGIVLEVIGNIISIKTGDKYL